MDKSSRIQSRKKKQARPSLAKSRMQTQILQEELDSGLVILERIKKQRDYMLAQVKLELQSQKDLKDKIEYLKKQYKLLTMSHAANQNILSSARNQRQSLDAEVEVLESTIRGLNGTSKNLLVQNDFARLIEIVNLDGKSHEKEKSVLLTCTRDLIKTTEENEFEGFIWRAKFANSKTALGLRLRFDQLSIREQDLKSLYTPIISGLAQKFKKYNLKVQTKTKSESGIVTAMDITFKMPTNLKSTQIESSPV